MGKIGIPQTNSDHKHMTLSLPSTPQLRGLAFQVAQSSSLLEGQLHPISQKSITHLLRIANGYYSLRIAKRDPQVGHQRHVELQEAVEQEVYYTQTSVTSPDFLQSLYRRMYEHDLAKPTDLLKESTDSLIRLHEAYAPEKHHGETKLLAAAASHYWLMRIPPFSHDNGHVVRLFSDAFLHQIPVSGYGLWIVNRGFALHKADYFEALKEDSSLNGERFCELFLKTSLTQIRFMDQLLQVNQLLERLKQYVAFRQQKTVPRAERLKPEALYLLQEALLQGQFPRGDASRITGFPERTARNLLRELVQEGLLISNTPKGPVRLGFTIQTARHWLPELFPDTI